MRRDRDAPSRYGRFAVHATLAWGGLLTLRSHIAYRRLRAERNRLETAYQERTDPTAPVAVLLVPMLREQYLAREVLDAVAQLRHPAGRLHVVAVTTQREESTKRRETARLPALAGRLVSAPPARARRLLRGLLPAPAVPGLLRALRDSQDPARTLTEEYHRTPTTRQTVAGLLPALRARHPGVVFHHVHDPRETGGKSDQMAWALEDLAGVLDGLPAGETYIGCYDADSLPDRRTLSCLTAAVAEDRRTGGAPALVQQVPLLLRRPHAARGSGGALPRVHALGDLRRRFGVEAWRIHARTRLHRLPLPDRLRILLEPVVYGVGAGMFVRLDTLRRVGGFEGVVDDLLVGYKLSAAGERMRVLPVFNLVDRYPDVPALAAAYRLVAAGGLDGCRRMLADRELGSAGARRAVVLAKEAADTLWWFAGPVVVLAGGLAVARRGPAPGTRAMALGAATYAVLHATWCAAVAREALADHDSGGARAEPLTRRQELSLLPLAPLQPLLHWLGPLGLAVSAGAARVTSRTVRLGKTER